MVFFLPSEDSRGTVESFNLLYQARLSRNQKMVNKRLGLGQSIAGARTGQVWLLPIDSDQIGRNLLANRAGTVQSAHVLHTTIEIAEDVDAGHLGAVVKAAFEVEDAVLLIQGVKRVVLLEAMANVDHKKEYFSVRVAAPTQSTRCLVKPLRLAQLVDGVCIAQVFVKDLVELHHVGQLAKDGAPAILKIGRIVG